jgi:four helix bundle protein
MVCEKMEGLNRLQVYQASQKLAKMVYQHVLPGLPFEEKYGLVSQIRRAAASIPANIAEGYCRYYYQESIRFCYIARGSLMELSSHIELAASQGYISDDEKTLVLQEMREILKLIHGYIKYLNFSKRGDQEPGSNYISEDISIYVTDEHINSSNQK